MPAFPTTISYRSPHPDGFGVPNEVTINGQPVTAITKIETVQVDEDYNEVTVTFRGVYLTVNPADEPSPEQA